MIKILKYGEVANSDIFARVVPEMDVEAIVADIIENVKENKDTALFEYCSCWKCNIEALTLVIVVECIAYALFAKQFF